MIDVTSYLLHSGGTIATYVTHTTFNTSLFSSSAAPNDKMKEVLKTTVEEAKALISKVRRAIN